jgi:hypothetical protein
MPTHNPDIILKSLRTDRKRLCFYPSCGNRSPWVVSGLDADVFVFSDKSPRTAQQRERFCHNFQQGFVRHGLRPILEFATVRTRFFRIQDKFMFLFFQDNNQALARIHNTGWQISTFVGICDGCAEGGNYECIHDDPFLSKVLATAVDGMEYITDHSALLASHNGMGIRFRRHVAHASGWEFTLHSLLFRDLQEGQDSYQILRFPERQRIPVASSSLSLACLLPMRRNYGSPMLAHYRVGKRPSPALKALSAEAGVVSITGHPCSEPRRLPDFSGHKSPTARLPDLNDESAEEVTDFLRAIIPITRLNEQKYAEPKPVTN